MRKIAIWRVKGGCGKSTVCAGLCYSLRDKGFKVGYLEIDLSGTSGHRAFGIDPPRLNLDTREGKLIPPVVEGIKMFPLASHFSEEACVAWRMGQTEIDLGDQRELVPGKVDFIKSILTDAVDWGDLHWLILDLPPSSDDSTFTFFEVLTDLYGVILVTQPSRISVVGMTKTLDFLKVNGKPILGLVENMAFALCPHCGGEFYPFTSERAEIDKLAKKEGLPVLGSIPQAQDMGQLKSYFDELASRLVKTRPRVLRHKVFSKRVRARGKRVEVGLKAMRLLRSK